METKYHGLRRPKRKLCYITNKESPSKHWAGKLSLGDIDGMFDDLDSSSHDDDIIPPSPLQTSNTKANLREREISPEEHLPRKFTGPGGDVLHSARRSLSPELDIVLGPVKTSSPIEEKKVLEAVEGEDNERALVVPQILNFKELKTDLGNTQNLQCNGHVAEGDDSDLESPSKVTFSKLTMFSHKEEVATTCKESHPVKEKTPKKSQISVLEVERKTPRQENPEPPALAVRPDCPSPEINLSVERQAQPTAEISTCRRKDIKSFLQKIRDAERTRSASSRGFQSLVKVPTPPPEAEDEFLILEDDAPLIYIQSKNSTRKRERQKETKAEQSSPDKDSSADNCTNDRSVEAAQKDEELEKANPKQESQPVNQKMKKNKGKDKKNEVTVRKDDKDDFLIPEDFPLSDLVEQEKPNKKKQRLKKVQSKEFEEAEEEPKGSDSRETDKETHTQKLETKTQKSSELKSLKSLKDGKGNAKKQHIEPQDLGYLPEQKIIGPGKEKAKILGSVKVKKNKLPSVPTESSSEESEVHGKRKRKQPGQWWLNCTEEAKVADKQPTLKKSKQNSKDPRSAVPSPVKVEKDRVLKRRHRKQPVPSSSENTNTSEVKKTKRKNRIIREETPDKRKTTDEVFKPIEGEQIEDQDEQHHVPVEDQDLPLSPLVLTQRDISSGNQVFQRVYHNVSNDKMSGTPASVSPRRNEQQLREGETDKRRRKPPGSWWLVNGMSNVECSSSQPQQLHHKEPRPCKGGRKPNKRSRSPRLGTPKNGNMAVLSKPLMGSSTPSTPSLKLKPLSAPKTVKRSLAMFTDIFTSATETETVMSKKDTCQNNRRNVTAHPAEEVGVLLQNHDTPPDSKCQSENTLKELRSGPSSMIQLEQYEENENLPLSPSRVQPALSISDMCGPPLKPLILQPKDKANLAEWFRNLWPTLAPNAAEITPNQFDWYFYQDRAIGFLLDVNCGSACIGRIVLGSYMKKPLWVDHNTSTVFNLLTSSVKVVIDGRESCFHAGQCFTVQCGHAYSIQNVTAQPAVLYFTRILSVGSD
ncbi:muscle M-line assembly protein unc-89 isoform X2 [Anabas testudineus]|uniref:muscle M-line assembly protein unc-89 isoform X2 n=1 Tax=Anabas testudineus TaxID=64144 RepID=UPI000E45F523|nr:muscle M-line assembly protein unc-89 isoform X2 [Anabas testudineus]